LLLLISDGDAEGANGEAHGAYVSVRDGAGVVLQVSQRLTLQQVFFEVAATHRELHNVFDARETDDVESNT
jgi:hypothetical protein